MLLHDLKLLLQSHFTDGLVTIVGSGLSCAEGLPGIADLGSYLESTLASVLSGEDLERWIDLRPRIASKGLEAALFEKPPTSTLEAAIVARTAELILAREREVVTKVFTRKRTLPFTKLLRHLLKPDTGVPVVTTNYDRLIEIAAEEAGLGVDTLFVGQFAGALNEVESRLSFCREVKLRGKNIH